MINKKTSDTHIGIGAAYKWKVVYMYKKKGDTTNVFINVRHTHTQHNTSENMNPILFTDLAVFICVL